MNNQTYQITKEIRIHHEDGWFYQFSDDGQGCFVLDYYEVNGMNEIKQGHGFRILKDCIPQFISVLEELK